MWFSFWKPRDRFSIQELRSLVDQLQRVKIVSEVNKEFIIESLRLIAELIIYGDQHDPDYFEFFMEKQVMGEFVRILKISRIKSVALQLLQTMSIMIQNLKSEHAIYYLFSNEHINYLITYSFDFHNEELLSYYISFLRAISGKLDKNTISLLMKTQNDEVVSFPLYSEAIRFAFHEESMIRIAVRALTLNVYHVGDDGVNKFVTSDSLSDYFSDLLVYFREQCVNLDRMVSECSPDSLHSTTRILDAVDEIEDNLYYFNDVMSSGVPCLRKLITENMLKLLVFPLLMPSLKLEYDDGRHIAAATSLYLLSSILHIVKTKDLANSICATLFCPREAFLQKTEPIPNGCVSAMVSSADNLEVNSAGPSKIHGQDEGLQVACTEKCLALRDVLLSFIVSGNALQVLGSLSLLTTFLQTKELDESMLDALGILPQRKQQKKLLLQALMGEESGEERLFSLENSLNKDGVSNELDIYLKTIKDQYSPFLYLKEAGLYPRKHRYQVLDALIHLFCRLDVPAETLWNGGWLYRQLLLHDEEEFNRHHMKLLTDTFRCSIDALTIQIRGRWCDHVISVLEKEWRRCKRAIEASSPQKDPKCILLPQQLSYSEVSSGESSSVSGDRMCEVVKGFVIRYQLRVFSVGSILPEQPPIYSPEGIVVDSRAKTTGVSVLDPKPGTEINLVDAVPCRIAFERGKERHFHFLAIAKGTSGWILLIEELSTKPDCGIVRIAAPLAGSNPTLDEKHLKWLHLRIRPSILPSIHIPESDGKEKSKSLVDGRWTLAFRDEHSCKSAQTMVLEEMNIQINEIETRLKPLFKPDNLEEQDSLGSLPPL